MHEGAEGELESLCHFSKGFYAGTPDFSVTERSALTEEHENLWGGSCQAAIFQVASSILKPGYQLANLPCNSSF